jgi:gamma-glutamyl-gamma-aminobutyrate hydrolase PuuD
MPNNRLPLIGIPCRGEVSRIYKGQPINTQNSTYIRAIIGAGGAPFLIPVEARGEILRILYEQADGILLTGGGDIAPGFFDEAPHPSLSDVQPERDELEFALIRWGLAEGHPDVERRRRGDALPGHPVAVSERWPARLFLQR